MPVKVDTTDDELVHASRPNSTVAMQAAFLKMYETSLYGTWMQNMDVASGWIAAKPVHARETCNAG